MINQWHVAFGAVADDPGFFFGQELHIAVVALRGDDTVADRLAHGAAGLVDVGAVAEAAFLGQFLDVRKDPGHVAVLQGQLPDARGVDDGAAVRKGEELPAGGGVPAPAVLFTDVSGSQVGRTEQAVDDGGFTHAG